jgi:hypothetical protein
LSEVLENQCVEQYCSLGDHQLRSGLERLRLPEGDKKIPGRSEIGSGLCVRGLHQLLLRAARSGDGDQRLVILFALIMLVRTLTSYSCESSSITKLGAYAICVKFPSDKAVKS